jgi:hypothetical protein
MGKATTVDWVDVYPGDRVVDSVDSDRGDRWETVKYIVTRSGGLGEFSSKQYKCKIVSTSGHCLCEPFGFTEPHPDRQTSLQESLSVDRGP